MTDDRAAPDRDLNIKAVVAVGIALAVATALAAVFSWWVSVGLRGFLEGRDARPPALLEARIPYQPPGPQLETSPEAALAATRAREQGTLTSYEWADAGETAARVPIERAMEILLETRPHAEAFGPEAFSGETLGGGAADEANDDG